MGERSMLENLAKASARSELRKEVEQRDITRVIEIVEKSLYMSVM